jgi:aerobic carbon-monoxide dehydrogenase small subunit
VLMDGAPMKACSVLALQAAGRSITTIEGVADGARLHALQATCLETSAVQCGYCTPGMIMTGLALIREATAPLGDEAIKRALEGNLCRCTGYAPIVQAIRLAQTRLSESVR